MFKKPRWLLAPAAFGIIAAFAIWGPGCGSSSPTASGSGDVTAPEVSSVDVPDALHIQVIFNEEIDPITSQREQNYGVYRTSPSLVEARGAAKSPAAYGDTLHCESAVLDLDGKTVILTVNPPTTNGIDYDLVVRNVKDISGNAMLSPSNTPFTGVGTQDQTPPTIVYHTPLYGANGVGVGQSVEVGFSEPMDGSSVGSAFYWTGQTGDVSFHMWQKQSNVYVFTPDSALDYNTQYTVGFYPGTARDWSLNYLDAVSWPFTTTNVPDNIAPWVASTYPQDGASNVPLDVVFQITFSEPVDENSLEQESILMNPQTSDGILTWTNGGKTLNFAPDSLLIPNTVYNLILIEGGIKDFAGNGLASSYSVVFTTGSSLPTGRFSGTISGDPNSSSASDPEGAMVVAMLENMLTYQGEGPPPMMGADLADHNGDYSIGFLGDDTYWPFAIMDSNHDGEVNPDNGDAVGLYGIDFSTYSGVPTPVIISGGNTVTNVDFAIFDPVAISGTVTYGGSTYSGNLENYDYYVGAFDTVGYDSSSAPDYGTDGGNLVWNPDYTLNQLGDGLTDGTYFVGAFLDVNYNGDYDPGVDPAGMYEAGGFLEPVTLEHGQDAFGVNIVLHDPPAGSPPPPLPGQSSWSKPAKGDPNIKRVLDLVRKALANMKAQ